jgi:hypothetical protein
MRIRHGTHDVDSVENISKAARGRDILERGVTTLSSGAVDPQCLTSDTVVIACAFPEGGTVRCFPAIDGEPFPSLFQRPFHKMFRDQHPLGVMINCCP